MRDTNKRAGKWLGLLALLYTAATVVHFIHNAELVTEYPNLPASLTRAGVYFALLVELTVGAVGLALYRFGWRRMGLLFVGLYALLGLDGLLHYTRAPFMAHSAAMNSTILIEVTAAAALLCGVIAALARPHRGAPVPTT
jgi:uncharacterized membrane protein